MRTEPNAGLEDGPSGLSDCELCLAPGGLPLWSDADWRLIRVVDDAFPGFYRLVSNRHVAEFSQLPPAARQRCMELLAWAEALVIRHLRPNKVNLASLGNMVPHLHWHLVARFDWDSHFPSPIWAAPRRPAAQDRLQALRAQLPALDAALADGPWHCHLVTGAPAPDAR